MKLFESLLVSSLIATVFGGFIKPRWKSKSKSDYKNKYYYRPPTASPTASPTIYVPTNDELCGCYQFNLVCAPAIINDEICYYYMIESNSDEDYCHPITTLTLGTDNDCGLCATDIDELIMDYAPKCYDIDPLDADGIKVTLNQPQSSGNYGSGSTKYDKKSSWKKSYKSDDYSNSGSYPMQDDYMIFSMCFKAGEVSGFNQNGQIGYGTANGGSYTCDTPDLPNFCGTPEPTTQQPTTSSPTSAAPTTMMTPRPTDRPITSHPTTNEPTTSNPTTASPTSATPTTALPTTAHPSTSEPTTSDPTTSVPTSAAPTTPNPTTSEPTTASPTSAAPTTTKPTTDDPTTSPTTLEPTTSDPTTSAPTSAAPTTANPTTSEPTTTSPTSAAPTTTDPTTSPTTSEPSTSNPTTAAPTTSNPTTSDPTTALPTSASPTTSNPTTNDPTTSPTTLEPTTSTPTTANPTSAAPTTSNPTTSDPTTSPTTLEPTTSDPTTADPTTSNPTTSAPTSTAPTTASPTSASPTTAFPTQSPVVDTCNATDAYNIAFLLDESGSVHSDEWDIIIEFIKRIVDYDVSPDSYVALYEFASLTGFEQFLDFTGPRSRRVNAMQRALDNNRYTRAGFSETWDAVNRVLDDFYDYTTDPANQARGNILFVVTDGDPTDFAGNPNRQSFISNQYNTCPYIENRLRQQFPNNYIDVVVIMIDPNQNIDISKVDCLDYYNNRADIISIESFDSAAFNAIENRVREKICTEGLVPSEGAGPGTAEWVYPNGVTGLGPVPFAPGPGMRCSNDPGSANPCDTTTPAPTP